MASPWGVPVPGYAPQAREELYLREPGPGDVPPLGREDLVVPGSEEVLTNLEPRNSATVGTLVSEDTRVSAGLKIYFNHL